MSGVISIGKVSHPSTLALNVRVDRQSALGNPFVMKSEADRDMVCDAYRAHLKSRIDKKDKLVIGELTKIYEMVMAGHDVQLNCWCAPKRCHAELIKMTVDKAVERNV
jgi:hypothetical protein